VHIKQKSLLLITFFIFIFLLFLIPNTDPDFGWHYRCGSELLKLQKPCIDNTFTYFLKDYKWAYPSFIYDALISMTFDLGGFMAVSLLGTLFSSLIIFVIYKTMRGDFLIRVALISTSTYFSWSTISLGFRSQFMTLLFLFAELYILLNVKVKSSQIKLIYFLPLLFLIWANTHAGFFLGPLVLGIYTVSIFYKHSLQTSFYKWIFKKVDFHELLNFALLTITGIIATLINPFGYRIYLEIYHHMQIPMNTLIAEWVPPPQNYVLLILTISGLLIYKHLSKTKIKDFNVFLLGLLLLSTYLAISARRNLPIYYFSAAIFASYEFRKFKIPEKWTTFIHDLSFLALFALTLYFGFTNVSLTYTFSKSKDNHCKQGGDQFLCKQLDFFKNETGNVYNTYEWGGFLVWKLPNMKFFIDGRMPAWIGENGESPYTTWLKITQTQPDWEQILNKYETDYLLIANGTFLDLLLRENPAKYNYNEVQRDAQAVIYEKI